MVPKRRFATYLWLMLFTIVAPAFAAETGAGSADVTEALRAIDPAEHVRFFSSHQSRYTGYPGCTESADYIVDRFRDIGLANITESPFQVVVPIAPAEEAPGQTGGERPPHDGTLSIGGRDVPLYCVMPNYARSPMTPPEGIRGRIVWGGEGYLKDLSGKNIEGSIVLMNFESMSRWLNAAKLGARAVVFIEPLHPFRTDAEQKYSELPLPVPRYYLRRADLPQLAAAVTDGSEDEFDVRTALEALRVLGGPDREATTGRVQADFRWEEVTVRRISGEIPGTDPQLSDETLVVFGYYDSVSVVPSLSPGAESASGIASLLEIAEFLKKHPPRRKVKFVAAPGHYQALAGARDYAAKKVYPRRNGPDQAAGEGTGEPYFFMGLDLSSRRNRFGAFYKGHFYNQLTTSANNTEVELQRAYSEYSSTLVDWMDELHDERQVASGLNYQSGIVPQQGRDWRSLQPDLVAFDSEVLSLCGYPGVTLATTGDPRNSVNTPLDTFDRVEAHLTNVRTQAMGSAWLIKQTADVPVLPVDRKAVWQRRLAGSVFGQAVQFSRLPYMPKVSVANAVMAVSMLAADLPTTAKSMMGVQTHDFQLSNVQGFFEVFGLMNAKQFRIDGFLMSPSEGVVSHVAESVLVEATNRPRVREWTERETDVRANFFRCVAATIFDLTDPLSLRTLGQSTARLGESNSELQYLVSYVGQESAGNPFSKPFATFFVQRDQNIKFLLAAGAVEYEGLLINFTREATGGEQEKKERTGTGYVMDQNENFIYHTAFNIVKDMHELDRYRLARLRASGIAKKAVWDLFNQAGGYIEAAERALRNKQYDDFYYNARMAWGLENRVYPDVRDTATDVVKGVVFYFALLLPFVLFAERLLINYVDIRKKLGAVAVLFVISYIVLRLVHPAFRLSQTPIIILDGFLMMVAALGTIYYLLGKFSIVMEHMRQKIDMIHRADVARASATMAAFILGISNMRKRKVRTGLTAVTLILLTFTILSFTSFETMPARMLEYASARQAPYEGVLLRGLGWGPLSEFVVYDMLNFFEVQGMRAAPRSWFVNPTRTEELQLEITRTDEGRGRAVANALLGLSPEERHFSRIHEERFLDHEWFDRSMPDWPFVCIVPARLKESLRIEDGEVGQARISVLGRDLRVVGVLRSDEAFRYEDLDGEEITPVDFVAQQFKEGGAAAGQQGGGGGGLALTATGEMDVEQFVHQKSAKEEEEEQYIHMEPDRIVVVPNELNLMLGGTVRAIAAGPGVASEAERTLRPFRQVLGQLLSRVNLALYAGYSNTPEGEPHVHRVATRSRISMGGFQGLLVPIVIAALIVFNTMLGAVYERMSEIKTYASVGLAPMHIAALFFAESSVFAVMGAMLGYIFGQVISKILVNIPWLMEGISLNYSSISAVWSALLVVVVVLASTAYPARMAGKLSVPDETRKMPIPKPTSDVWEIWFPFTVSSKETLGVMSYLREYFESNDEDAVGSFTADNIRFYTEMEEGLEHICLEADVWVAPLDMGVSQTVKIASVPDPEEGDISYLFFTITRKSGEFQTWHRMNLGFLKDLRKQLLIWRLVTPEAKKRLSQEGEELLDRTASTADAE
ncbi:MAG: M28 family peptidase [Candidatus Brocadiia bacterium]